MIDTKARLEAAQIIRRFISGHITNFELENTEPESNDLAIREIYGSIWCFYDDFKEHKLSGSRVLPEETQKQLIRWILFLHTEEEYKWPPISHPGIRPIQHGIFSILFNGPAKEQRFMKTGDYNVWPFFSTKSFNRANNNPKLLHGI